MSSALKRFVPLFDRVLVQRIKPQEKTAAGILLPQKSQETTNEANVVAVGPGSRAENGQIIPMSLKAGDKVLLTQYGGNTIKLEGEEYTILRESEVLGKIDTQ